MSLTGRTGDGYCANVPLDGASLILNACDGPFVGDDAARLPASRAYRGHGLAKSCPRGRESSVTPSASGLC